MAEIHDFDVAAANNNQATPDGYPEGQAPSTLNDCARETHAAIARFFQATRGTVPTAGTGNAYTLAISMSIPVLADLPPLTFKANRANTGPATLAVNALPVKAIVGNDGTALVANDILLNQVVEVVYESVGDHYRIISPYVPATVPGNKTFGGILSATTLQQGGVPVVTTDTAQTITVAKTIRLSSGATVLNLETADAGAQGPIININHDSASPAVNDVTGVISFLADDDGGASDTIAQVSCQYDTVTAASEDATLLLRTMRAGVRADRVKVGTGVQIGAPTGGDKGAGTLNAATNIYVNNVPVVTETGTQTLTNKTVNYVAAADVASATPNIGAAASNNVRITGTTTITAFDTVAAGITRKVRFAAVLTLTHNATSLILPGSANIVTAADDTAEFLSLGTGNWLCLWYKPSAAAPITNTEVVTSTGTFTAKRSGEHVIFLQAGGGGGGGGSTGVGGGGGGGGAAGKSLIFTQSLTAGTGYTVTIGGGGGGGAAGLVGTIGGDSVFDATTVTGGNPANGAGAASGGASGGAAATVPGGAAGGGAATAGTSTTSTLSGAGGAGGAGDAGDEGGGGGSGGWSMFGQSGAGGAGGAPLGNGTAGGNALFPGAGGGGGGGRGSGGGTTGGAGGNGADGIAIVFW